MRYIVTGGILLATLGWLVLSYMPQVVAALPKLTFGSAVASGAFLWMAVGTLLLFLIIQFDLVRVTAKWFHLPEDSETALALVDFGLRRRQEIFWTVLPLLGTVVLGAWLWIVR